MLALAPSARFDTTRMRTWMIDVKMSTRQNFYELYLIVRATPKSILVHCGTQFSRVYMESAFLPAREQQVS